LILDYSSTQTTQRRSPQKIRSNNRSSKGEFLAVWIRCHHHRKAGTARTQVG